MKPDSLFLSPQVSLLAFFDCGCSIFVLFCQVLWSHAEGNVSSWCNSHSSLKWPPSTLGDLYLFWPVPTAPIFSSVWKLSCVSSLLMVILASDVSSLELLSIFWIRHKPKILNTLSHWRSDNAFHKRRWLTSMFWPQANLALDALPTRNSSCCFNGHVVFHFLSQTTTE